MMRTARAGTGRGGRPSQSLRRTRRDDAQAVASSRAVAVEGPLPPTPRSARRKSAVQAAGAPVTTLKATGADGRLPSPSTWTITVTRRGRAPGSLCSSSFSFDPLNDPLVMLPPYDRQYGHRPLKISSAERMYSPAASALLQKAAIQKIGVVPRSAGAASCLRRHRMCSVVAAGDTSRN